TNGLTISGSVRVEGNATLRVGGGLTLDGNLTLDNGTVRFEGMTQWLAGSGSIVGTSENARIYTGGPGDTSETFTIGSDIDVHFEHWGFIVPQVAGSTMILNGTITGVGSNNGMFESGSLTLGATHSRTINNGSITASDEIA